MNVDRVIDGRYEVGDVIGRGATAHVHRGRDIRTGRSVAIKMLRKDLVRDPVFQSRLEREAMTVAGLSHPAIVSIYDTGYEEVGDGSAGKVRVPFIVMEYVEGRSLRDLLRRRGLTLGRTIRYQVGILSALDFSHRAGIVHRDIKPANVMITPKGAVKVVDFGISHAIGGPAATLTQAQAFVGTPSYLSPEQARGETVDARSDLYSAGCVLYELLTGRPPFVGDNPLSVAYQHVHEQPPQVRTARPALDAVLAKALAKERDDRFQDARSFEEALLSAVKYTKHVHHGAFVSTFDTNAPLALTQGSRIGMADVGC